MPSFMSSAIKWQRRQLNVITAVYPSAYLWAAVNNM